MERSRDLLTGFVFFGLLLVLGAFTIVLAGMRFGPVSTVVVFFEEGINGLEEGNEVRVDGYRNGKVRKIELAPREGRIYVTAAFDKEPIVYGPVEERDDEGNVRLRGGATFTVAPASPLGGRVLEIRNPRKAEARGPVLSLSVPQAGGAEPDALREAAKILEDNRENVRKAVENLASFSESLNRDGRLLLARLSTTVDEVSGIVADVREGRGTVGRLFTDDTIARRVEKILIDVDEGAVGELLRDGSLKDDLVATVANLKRVSEMLADGEGTAGMLLKDKEELYEKLVAVLDDIKVVTSSLSPDRGILKVLGDEETGRQLKSTLASAERVAKGVEEIIQGVKEGKGTLGLLLRNEEMAQKLQMAFARLDDFLEEQRENTTFLTFATLLLGAF